MASGSQICSHCGGLNGASEARCHRCGAPLRGGLAILLRVLRVEHIATKTLIGICLLNFLVMCLANRGLPLAILGRPPSGFSVLFVGGIRGTAGAQVELFRWLSAVYVHLGVLHLVMNMMALRSLGSSIEESQGPGRMLVLYVVSGIVGFAASRLYFGPISPSTAGASGAIFGLLGVRISEIRHVNGKKAREILYTYLAYAVGFALLFPVNNAAHFGGFASAFVLTEVFRKVPRRVKPERIILAAAGFLLVLSVLSQLVSAIAPATRTAARVEAIMLQRR